MDITERAEAARDRMAREMRALVNDAEEMLKAASKQGGEQLGAVRERLERSVGTAKAELINAEHAVVERARRTARETDEYVHDHPWTAVGVGAGIGLLLGLLLGRR
ncbi:MAG: DUF883 domain-containing protein [Burkholderiales bacterium]|nr:MAG: DUF883 domain-containing protein [Burkholderiales bacterium]